MQPITELINNQNRMTTGDLSINENKKKVETVLSFICVTLKTLLNNQMSFKAPFITSFCKFITSCIFRLQH